MGNCFACCDDCEVSGFFFLTNIFILRLANTVLTTSESRFLKSLNSAKLLVYLKPLTEFDKGGTIFSVDLDRTVVLVQKIDEPW